MSDTINYELIPLVEVKKDFEKLFNTFKTAIDLTDEQVATAVSIATDACPHCWEHERGCQCWNDE